MNRKMGVGVIGSGAISDIYLKNMIEKYDNLEVICIASRNPEHAKKKAPKYGIRACTQEEMLDDPKVEMIVNLTPVKVHYEICKKALLAGKHVYTEKTIADRPELAEDLLRLAKERKLYIGSAPDTFMGAAWQTARYAVQEGMLGELLKKTEEEFESEPTEKQREILSRLSKMHGETWLEYLKMGDGQFLELFYNIGEEMKDIGDRRRYYGYSKVNFEVADINEIRNILMASDIQIDEVIHPTMDGAMEIVVHDPDGNEVQFTEYRPSGKSALVLTDESGCHSCSNVCHTTQVAFDVKDAQNMEQFYCRALGLRKACTLTFGELADCMAEVGQDRSEMMMELKMMGDAPWVTYLEAAPHQYIELFRTMGEPLQEKRDLSKVYGYRHLCLEVKDIHAAWDAVYSNGISPDSEIAPGLDGSYQFWLTDPDGNRIELMQYTEASLQNTGD